MAKVLYIQASPRKERSKSNKLAEEFINFYKEKNPKDEIITINLFEKVLPPFDGLTIKAKYNLLHGREHTQDEKKAWKVVEEIIDEFKSADKYIFSVPMWNFGIPYKLKQYFDIIVQPSYTFKTDPKKGYIGLVTDKPAALLFARGGDYSDPEKEKVLDHQKSYMQLILGFIGFTEIKTLTYQPTLAGGPEITQEKLEQALENTRNIAKLF